MKVLYYTHTYFLDCDLPLVEQLIKKGIDVLLIIDLPYYQLQSTMVNISKQIPQNDVLNVSSYSELGFISHYISLDKVFVLNRCCKVYEYGNLLLRRTFAKIIKQYEPDVIHCTDFIDLSDFFLYIYRKKILQVVHDPFPHSGERTFKKSILRTLEYKMVKNYVLLNSRQKKEFLFKNKLKASHIYQAALGVYSCLHEFKNENNIVGGEQYILFFGRISPYKGVEYLIQAVEQLHQENMDVTLVIAGGGNLYFKNILSGKPYVKVINNFLSMDELYSLIAHCKFVVCPYIDATQSGVIMSAFALDKVVVGTDVGGIPQMLRYGELGPIVPPKSIKELSVIIKSLCLNERLLDNYRSKIQEACTHGVFSWEKIAEKYINVYKKIAYDTSI